MQSKTAIIRALKQRYDFQKVSCVRGELTGCWTLPGYSGKCVLGSLSNYIAVQHPSGSIRVYCNYDPVGTVYGKLEVQP